MVPQKERGEGSLSEGQQGLFIEASKKDIKELHVRW